MTKTLPFKGRTQRELLDALRACIDVVGDEDLRTSDPNKWFEAGLQLSRILHRERDNAKTKFIMHNIGMKRRKLLNHYYEKIIYGRDDVE